LSTKSENRAAADALLYFLSKMSCRICVSACSACFLVSASSYGLFDVMTAEQELDHPRATLPIRVIGFDFFTFETFIDCHFSFSCDGSRQSVTVRNTSD
jgi:hypothetical protein